MPTTARVVAPRCRGWWAGAAGGLLGLLAACETPPTAPAAPAAASVVVAVSAPPIAVPVAAAGREVTTRNAVFRPATFAELPGWAADDAGDAAEAFRGSCQALARRENWRSVCAAFERVPRGAAPLRQFFEREFALFQIVNPDASRVGEFTGYYEPLINGSSQRQANFSVPVYGTPNDLYTIDWNAIPTAQRRSTKVNVVAQGRELVVVAAPRVGSLVLDASQFEPDTRDRRWRVRITAGVARPYLSRADIDSAPQLDAPVLAWVDDALGLYAMQLQGTGRVQLRDGRVLRLQYAEQNGHPFRPLRLAARPVTGLVTRGAVGVEPERFELAEPAEPGASGPVEAPLVTRGARPASPPSAALVDELLAGARRPGTAAAPATRPTTAPVATASGGPRPVPLQADPSYVFFRIAADQSPARGPIGALGVPLTAGRSIAVDPRVTPMGYPVYVSAPAATSTTPPLQRLVVAQDTGGAIRGAIRADVFWGHGPAAGRQALGTHQRGQMWLLLPRSEAATLLTQRDTVTRSARRSGPAGGAECLVADGVFCDEAE